MYKRQGQGSQQVPCAHGRRVGAVSYTHLDVYKRQGPYQVSAELVNIGPVFGTQMACTDEINNQEATYLNAVQSAVTFEMTLDTLILRDGFGQEVVRFTRVG